jgi:LPXTG-site transpeptidase (sortase) family protein
MKRFLPIALVVVMLLTGIGLMVYPDISSWYNGRIHTGLVQAFDEEVSGMDDDYIEYHLQRAQRYNDYVFSEFRYDLFADLDTDLYEFYLETLNAGGIMATIEIPIIDMHLPVFHTVSTDVLNRGIGHIERTSFPIGGRNTHSVLSGHSGLPHSRMFTDLEELIIGDIFFITALNYTLAYQVDRIIVVLPHEVEYLRVIPGFDHVTLITCTPYAINSHRLLVRGERIPYEPGMINEIEPITNQTNWRIIIIVAISLLFFIIFAIYFRKVRKGGQ